MYPLLTSEAETSHFSLLRMVARVRVTLMPPLFFPFVDLMISILLSVL